MASKDLEIINMKNEVKQAKKVMKVKNSDNEMVIELQTQLVMLNDSKIKAEELNKSIMNQVSIMKEAIKDSRDTEIRNKQLLEQLKAKTESMNCLKLSEKQQNDTLIAKDEYIQ